MPNKSCKRIMAPPKRATLNACIVGASLRIDINKTHPFYLVSSSYVEEAGNDVFAEVEEQHGYGAKEQNQQTWTMFSILQLLVTFYHLVQLFWFNSD